jgi:hypothetical protein
MQLPRGESLLAPPRTPLTFFGFVLRIPRAITPLQTRCKRWRKRDAICVAVFPASLMQSFRDTALR